MPEPRQMNRHMERAITTATSIMEDMPIENDPDRLRAWACGVADALIAVYHVRYNAELEGIEFFDQVYKKVIDAWNKRSGESVAYEI